MKVSEATFKTCVFTLKVKTGLAPSFHDITDSVAEFVKQSELRNAFAHRRDHDPGKRAVALDGHGFHPGAICAVQSSLSA